MVGEIQRGTQSSVKQMKHGVSEVEEGVELADMTGQAMRRIRDSFNDVMQVVQEISEALNEQNRASDEVAETVERFAGMAQQNQEATRHSSGTAHTLQSLAAKLEQTVKRFSLD
jgi:methyl-accepting chemotaxis protein